MRSCAQYQDISSMLSSEGEDEIRETDPGGGIEVFYIKFIYFYKQYHQYYVVELLQYLVSFSDESGHPILGH